MTVSVERLFAQGRALYELAEHRFEPTEHVSAMALKCTAYLLITHANRRTGEAWPSKSTLAAELGAGERLVQNALRELVRLGLVERRAPGYCGRRSATYVVRIGQYDLAPLRKAAPEHQVEHQVELVAAPAPPASSPRTRSVGGGEAASRAALARSAYGSSRRRSASTAPPPPEELCALMEGAYSRARERRYGVGTEPIPPAVFAEPLRVAARVTAATGAGVELAIETVAGAYLRQAGRADGRLEELHHPLNWFVYYASRVEIEATHELTPRKAPPPPPLEHVIIARPFDRREVAGNVASVLAAMGVAA